MLGKAKVVASDETGVRIEGTNAYHWVFHCKDAVVHWPDYTRAGRVVDEVMGGHVPEVWISDRYGAQQDRGARQQTCLAHYADVQIMPTRVGNLASSAVIIAMGSA